MAFNPAAFYSQDIVGASAATRTLLQRIALVAPTNATVLIQGETGTGKELIAREVHKVSRRKEQPLIKVNCLTETCIVQLQNYNWPGNIRELRNVIERAAIVAQGNALEFDLPGATATAANPEII